MKMLKKTLIPILLIAALVCTLALTSCKQECNHEFGEWTVTKAATCTVDGTESRTCSLCGETEEKTIAAEGHKSEDLLCGTCGDEMVAIDSLLPSVDPTTVSSIGLTLKNVKLTDIDTENPNDSSVTTLELAEFFLYTDESGALYGYGHGAATLTYGVDSTRHSVIAYIEGEYLYLENVTGNEVSNAKIRLADIMNGAPMSDSLKVLEEKLPLIEAWVNDSLLPAFTTPTSPIDPPEITEAQKTEALASVINTFFNVEARSSGTAVVLDLELIRDTHNALNTKTVAQLIDAIGGEGSFLKLQALIPTVLDFSVEDFVKFLSLNLGVDIPKLLTALDELAFIISEDESARFEDIFGIEGDIGELLENEEFLKMKVKDFLLAAAELPDEAALNTIITELTNKLSTSTVYQLMELDADEIAVITESIDMIVDGIRYEIILGAEGEFVKSTLAIAFPKANVYAGAVITPDKITVNVNDGEDGMNNIDLELALNPKVSVDEEAALRLKSALANAPEVGAELLALENYIVLPDPNGNPLGIIYDSHYVIEGDTIKLDVRVYIPDNTASFMRVTQVCNSKYNYSYEIPAVCQDRLYTVTKADLTVEEIYEIVLSDAEYEIYFQTDDTLYLTFGYDKESGELDSDGYTHSFELDIENSVFPDEVACGETYCYVDVCTECGFVDTDEYVKEHGEDMVKTSLVYDENSGEPIAVEYTCICGVPLHTLKVDVSGSPVKLDLKSVEGEESEPLDLEFTIDAPGNYAIIVYSNADDGYIHLYYETGYFDTAYYAGDGTAVVFTAERAGYYYLNFYAYNWEDVTEVSISITPVAG